MRDSTNYTHEYILPLTGGTVSGKGYRGQSGEFESVPQAIRIGHEETGVLRCLAASAQSYEWYEDGILVEGETGDSLTLTWERRKAKADKHTHIYSVVPVYTVFNETERGEAATTQVEFTPLGTSITIR